MSRRIVRISQVVDCEDETCGRCAQRINLRSVFSDRSWCEFFHQPLVPEGRGYGRLYACKNAEVRSRTAAREKLARRRRGGGASG